MRIKVVFCILFFFLLVKLCFDQKKIEFLKVYRTIEYPVPPFPKDVIEIQNYQICFRTELPPRQNMSKEFLEYYDMTDQAPWYRQIDTTDFDSIVKYVLTSGLLNIDMGYTKPKSDNGIVIAIMGGCVVKYFIETSSGKLELLVSGDEVFELPLILKQFDDLFNRIQEKYRVKRG